MKDVLKIELENIQAVKKASIEIEGFTAVVGRSNSGKSSLIRGMHAALTNKSPKTIFRTGTKESRVKLEDKSKEISIEWKKGEKINAYVIDGKEYTKVGKEVPKEIEEHGFKEIRVNDESLEVQFARQHEYIFLLNRSGGFVADFISKITKADVLTGAVKDCESDIRKCNDNLKASQKEKDGLDEQLQKFTGLNQLETDLGETITDIESAVKLNDQVAFLEQSCSEKTVREFTISKLKGIPSVPSVSFDVDEITYLDIQITERSALNRTLSTLSNIPVIPECSFDTEMLANVEKWSNERDEQKERYVVLKSVEQILVPACDFKISDLEMIDLACEASKKIIPSLPTIPDVSSLQSKIESATKLQGFSADYESIERELLGVRDEIQETEEQIKAFQKLKKELQQELGGCPTCGRGFDGNQEDDKNCVADSR
jgi:DNA repair ATPase RecN